MTLYTLDRGPIDPTPIDLTPPGLEAGTFTALVGQALSDLTGVDAALTRVAGPIVDVSGVNPESELTPYEAMIVESQQRDRRTMSDLYAVDEGRAGEAIGSRQDGALRDVTDVQRAHGGLSPRIDEGAREIPPEPPLPDDINPDPRERPRRPPEKV